MQRKVPIEMATISDILGQAIEHESDEMKRYHSLALRYVTFRSSLAQQMADIANEC